MTNTELKKLLILFFEAKYLDEIGASSSDSVLASLAPDTKQGAMMRWSQKVWGKIHKSTRNPSKTAVSFGGLSQVDQSPILRQVDALYAELSAQQRNMLREHIEHERSYEEITKIYRDYRLTVYQVREVFRRKIYPFLLENLAHLK